MKEEKEENKEEEKRGKVWRVADMEKQWRKSNKQGKGWLYQQSHFNLLERRLSKEV